VAAGVVHLARVGVGVDLHARRLPDLGNHLADPVGHQALPARPSGPRVEHWPGPLGLRGRQQELGELRGHGQEPVLIALLGCQESGSRGEVGAVGSAKCLMQERFSKQATSETHLVLGGRRIRQGLSLRRAPGTLQVGKNPVSLERVRGVA